MINVTHTRSPQRVAAQALSMVVQQYADAPMLLLVSGGSWLRALEHLPVHTLPTQCTIGLLDERYSTNVTENNFAQLQATTFFTRASNQRVSWLSSVVEPKETFAAYVARFEQNITTWQHRYPDGRLVVTFGMGEDGHTAGIMPGYVSSCWETEEKVFAYEVPPTINKHTKRVTTTSCLWKQAVAGVALVSGKSKCVSLRYALQCEAGCEQYPAALWHVVPKVKVVTDC